MKKTKITLLSQTILQLDAGSYEAIVDGDKTFILLHQTEGADLGGSDNEPDEVTDKKATKTKAKAKEVEEEEEEEEEAETASTDSSTWSEDDMMEMETDDLLDEADKLGIKIPKKGKNTNKKIRTLILEHYAESEEVADDDEEEEEEEAPRRRSKKKKTKDRKLVEVEDWDELEEGDKVVAKLDMPDDEEASEKLWEAKVVGWKKPTGSKKEALHVLFDEDGQEDYMRKGDTLYEYREEL